MQPLDHLLLDDCVPLGNDLLLDLLLNLLLPLLNQLIARLEHRLLAQGEHPLGHRAFLGGLELFLTLDSGGSMGVGR
jgi:hypothetical protein